MRKPPSEGLQSDVQAIRKPATKPRARITPLSRMLSRGGIVYVPIRPYLKRLQTLHKEENLRGHANLLDPGLAYLLSATDEQLANSFVAILGESKVGEHLEGRGAFSVQCSLSGASMLLLGLAFYVFTRVHPPRLLEWLQFSPTIRPTFYSNVLFGSFPDFLHAAAFTFLLAATLRPSFFTISLSALLWSALDSGYELACANHGAIGHELFQRMGLSAYRWPQCTCDIFDVIAAFCGAIFAEVVMLVFLYRNKDLRT
jgi:hypothetical protein